MRVLVIGVYRDGTGWSQACTDYILALDAAGVDVVCRPLKLNDVKHKPPQRILELEAKSSKGCDYVIQHVLPHQMDYNGHFKKNIGLYASETSNFRSCVWGERLNNMDEAWVINRQMVEAARASGVTIPITVIPHATNVERFQQSYETLDVLKPHKDSGEFLFYFVGEMVRRKNLAALLKAFHTEFDPAEPVRLVIKTSKPGIPTGELRQHVVAFCNEIKRGLKLHGQRLEMYKEEVILLDRYTDHGLLRLHASCDCFVMPSYGEAWGIPAFDAMAMGKTPIVTACTGFLDYVSDKEGWLVKFHPDTVFGVDDSFEDLFTGKEEWSLVDIGNLRSCMREAYSRGSLREEKAAAGIERAYDFSYEVVGKTMRERLLSYEQEVGRT